MSPRAAALLVTLLGLSAPLAAHADASGSGRVDDLTLEELLEIEVTSASKKPQRIGQVPAAIYVITQEDIRRSGQTSIPELLRMVPGVNVRKSTVSGWHVGIRGDQDKFSRTLLPLVDGRSVYTSTFSGTYWDFQEIPLEDIERIEVIRGPGASIWGSNAVQGVINIIRKPAAQDEGSRVSVLHGNEEHLTTSFAHSGSLGRALDFRASGRYVNRDASKGRDGSHAVDDYRLGTLQLRADLAATERDTVTLQGDWVGSELGGRFRRDLDTTGNNFFVEAASYGVRGGNSMLKWHHQISERASTDAQLYWDTSTRDLPLYREIRSSWDLELRNRIELGRHDLNWGVGGRRQGDRWNDSLNLVVEPDEQAEAIYHSFAQDDIAVTDALKLTFGTRLEWNTYTGWEVQPSARFFYAPQPRHQFWGSLARAVRIPARSDREITVVPEYVFGLPISFAGDQDFDSEVVVELDLGYRLQPAENLQLDLTAFARDTENFKVYEGVVPFIVFMDVIVPAYNTNRGEAQAIGAEASIRWEVRDWWRLALNYSHCNISSNTPLNTQGAELSAPHHLIVLQHQLSLPGAVEVGVTSYYSTRVRDIGGLESPSYMRHDARIAWQPTPRLELAVVGQNLFNPLHFEARDFFEVEGFTGRPDSAVQRSIFGEIRAQF